jgi:hypothetical protein
MITVSGLPSHREMTKRIGKPLARCRPTTEARRIGVRAWYNVTVAVK